MNGTRLAVAWKRSRDCISAATASSSSVTNRGWRGTFNIEALNSIHDKMHRLLAGYGGVIEAIFFCPHSPDDGCGCRKPRPGLYLEVAKRLRIKLNNVSAVGDKLSDIQAATAGGAKPVLVRTGYGKLVEDGGTVPDGVPIFDDLAAVVDRLLQH